MNKDLSIVKSVQNFKFLRNELYNWGQIVEISNKLFLLFAIFALFSSLFEIIIKAPPLLVGTSAVGLTGDDLAPNSIDGTIVYLIYAF